MTYPIQQIKVYDAEVVYQAMKASDEFYFVEFNREKGIIYCTIERYAMDGHGYHVGYERFKYTIGPLLTKERMGVYNMGPWGLSKYVFLHADITNCEVKVIPAEEEHRPTKTELIEYIIEMRKGEYTKTELRKMSKDEIEDIASNLGYYDGVYYPADEDFAYEVFRVTMEDIVLKIIDENPNDWEYTYNAEGGYWSLGDLIWDIENNTYEEV